jgi:hypothetical protein
MKILAYSGGVLRLGATDYILDLNGMQVAEAGVPILLQHEATPNAIVGQATEVEITNDGVMVEASLADTEPAKIVAELAKAGYRWQASVGADVLEEEELPQGEHEINGQKVSGPIRVARKWQLREVSIVVLGADSAARLVALARKSPDSTKRYKVPQVFVVSRSEGQMVNAQVLSVALGRHLRLPEDKFPEDVRQLADKFKGLTFKGLIYELARANGYAGSYASDTLDQWQYACGIKAAANSSTNLQSVVKDVAQRALNRAFAGFDQSWRDVARIRSVDSFRTYEFYRATGNTTFEPVGPDGQLKHANFEDVVYTGRIETQGKYMQIDRRHIINDDIGVIDDLVTLFARGAALRLNNMFWGTFLNNGAFFTTARGNYASGSTTALGIDSLSQANGMFMLLKDETGEFTGLMPAKLLVPASLSSLATQLISSTTLFDTQNKAVSNPHAGKYVVVVSRYLEDTRLSGNSSKAWYLLASPDVAAVIDVLALNGQTDPTIETVDVQSNQLGIAMRGWFDVGVTLADYQAGVKMKGEA